MFAWLKQRRKRQLLLALAAALLAVLGPYAVSRLRSSGRRVRRDFTFRRLHRRRALRPSACWPSTSPTAGGRAEGNWAGSDAEKRRRVEGIARLIADAEADVVVLNEVDFDSTWSGHQNQAEAIARVAGYPHRVEQRNFDLRFLYGSWKFGNAVLSRYPIERAELVRLPALRGWEEALAGSKQGLVCEVRLSASQRVRLLAVHLEPRSAPVRAASAQAMVDLIASSDLPLIATGDFNAAPAALPEGDPSAVDRSAVDVLVRSGGLRLPESDGSAERMTWSSTRPTRALDWVLAPDGWRFAEYRVIRAQLSDHRPVLATLEYNGHSARFSPSVSSRSTPVLPAATMAPCCRVDRMRTRHCTTRQL